MKILISVLLISSLSLLSETQCTNSNSSNEIQESCNCSSLFCNCSATCSNNASCSCGFTCDCSCSGSNGTGQIPEENEESTGGYKFMPTSNGTQVANSIATQAYFNDLDTESGTAIAGYFQTLRNAIENEDIDTYRENAPLLDEAFQNLTESEQNAYVTWAMANLTPTND